MFELENHLQYIQDEPGIGIHFLSDIKDQILAFENLNSDSQQTDPATTQNQSSTLGVEVSAQLPQQCQFCTKSFNQRCQLDLHYLKHHRQEIQNIDEMVNSKIHSCEQCDFETTLLHDLRRHMMVHDKEFKCTMCDMSFPLRKTLNSHIWKDHRRNIKDVKMKIHCCPLCSYKTSHSSNLKKHLIVHAKRSQMYTYRMQRQPTAVDMNNEPVTNNEAANEPFQCNECGYIADTKTRYHRHLLVHASAKPYVCESCSKGFIKKIQLESHYLTHHKDEEHLADAITSKIYNCDKCSYKTVLTALFKSHLQNKHKE